MTGSASRSEEFRAAVEIVIIDPSAPYASGIRAALPHAKLAIDKWHLVALANADGDRGPAADHP